MSTLLQSIKIKAKLLQKAKLKNNTDFKLKDAYELLAKTAGYANWREWKTILDEHHIYAPQGSAYWHIWFSQYDQALAEFKKLDSQYYLIPHQKHFFICDVNFIFSLGLEVDDSDLLNVGRNWVEPENQLAWRKILLKIQNQKNKNSNLF